MIRRIRLFSALFCRCSDGSTVVCDSAKESDSCTGIGSKNFYVSVTVQEDIETLLDYPAIGRSFKIENEATFRVE